MVKVDIKKIKKALKSGNRINYNGNGQSRICNTINAKGCRKFVVLSKYWQTNNSFFNFLRKNFEKNKFLVNNIINLGIRTPKLYNCFVLNNKFCEVHEKMQGEPIVESELISIGKLLNNKEAYFKLDKEEKQSVIKRVAKQNLTKLECIVNAPSSHFQEYFKMCSIAYSKFGHVFFDDLHSGNLLYSKNIGFSFIDLPLDEMVYDFVKEGGKNNSKNNALHFSPFKKEELLNAQGREDYKNFFVKYSLAPFNHAVRNISIYYDDDEEFEVVSQKLLMRAAKEIVKFGLTENNDKYALLSRNCEISFLEEFENAFRCENEESNLRKPK